MGVPHIGGSAWAGPGGWIGTVHGKFSSLSEAAMLQVQVQEEGVPRGGVLPVTLFFALESATWLGLWAQEIDAPSVLEIS